MDGGLLIGIDGGGTHSTAAAVWPDGRVAALAEGGGCNYHHAGVEAVRERIGGMVRTLCEQAHAQPAAVCVGMSALDGPADAQTRALFQSDALRGAELDLQSDAYAALMGLTRGGSGMIAICGTGSMLLLMDEMGRQHASGGWGYLLDDAGSGYGIARDALLAVAAASDGVGPDTPLTGLALAFFGADAPRGLIPLLYAPSCTPDRVAGFARLVLAQAEQGDPVAGRILRDQMDRLAALADALFRKADAARLVGLYGGIFAHSAAAREAFGESLRSRLPEVRFRTPEYPPELGAVIHLMRRRGPVTEAALERMKQTSRAVYQAMRGTQGG